MIIFARYCYGLSYTRQKNVRKNDQVFILSKDILREYISKIYIAKFTVSKVTVNFLTFRLLNVFYGILRNEYHAIFMKSAFIKSLSGCEVSTKKKRLIYSVSTYIIQCNMYTDFCIRVRDITHPNYTYFLCVITILCGH